MKLRFATCSTCGFETFVSDQSTMERLHQGFDGAHEPYWYENDTAYAFDEIHILSATSVILDDGKKYHLTHCHAAFQYRSTASAQHGSYDYVIGNYAGSRGATCTGCLADWTARYGPH